MRALRTPDERFAELPAFDSRAPLRRCARPATAARCGWRWVEDGPADGPVVLLLHGEPSWSFLYRTMIPVLAAAGLRAVAPDLVGFGRSDKPAELADHSYARHVEWVRALAFDVARPALRSPSSGRTGAGCIGLRLVAEHPERFAAVVAANTGLPTGDRDMPEVWWRFRRAVETGAGTLDVARLVQSGCRTAAARRRPRRLRRAVPGPRRSPRARGRCPCSCRPAPDDPATRGQPGRLGGRCPAASCRSCARSATATRSPPRWSRSCGPRCPAPRAGTIRRSPGPGTSSRRTPGRRWPRPSSEFVGADPVERDRLADRAVRCGVGLPGDGRVRRSGAEQPPVLLAARPARCSRRATTGSPGSSATRPTTRAGLAGPPGLLRAVGRGGRRRRRTVSSRGSPTASGSPSPCSATRVRATPRSTRSSRRCSRAAGDTDFAVLCSDVVYPAGGVERLRRQLLPPVRRLPRADLRPARQPRLVRRAHRLHDRVSATRRPTRARRRSTAGPLWRRVLRGLLWRTPRRRPTAEQVARDALVPRRASAAGRPARAVLRDRRRPGAAGLIDTGINGRIDGDQGAWLRAVSRGVDRPKILLTGKPLYIYARLQPCPIEARTGGADVDEIVSDPAHNYVAAIGGDVHNYQRYPVLRRTAARSSTSSRAAAGPSCTATHTDPERRPARPACDEEDFRCYPLRGDSLALYSRRYDKVLGFGSGRLRDRRPTTPRRSWPSGSASTRRARAPRRRVTGAGRRAADRVFPLPAQRPRRRATSWSRCSSTRTRPPLFKSFLRLDADGRRDRAGSLLRGHRLPRARARPRARGPDPGPPGHRRAMALDERDAGQGRALIRGHLILGAPDPAGT